MVNKPDDPEITLQFLYSKCFHRWVIYISLYISKMVIVDYFLIYGVKKKINAKSSLQLTLTCKQNEARI